MYKVWPQKEVWHLKVDINMDFDLKILRSVVPYNVKLCVELWGNHLFLSVINFSAYVDFFSCNRYKSAMWYKKRRIPSQNLVTDYNYSLLNAVNKIYNERGNGIMRNNCSQKNKFS